MSGSCFCYAGAASCSEGRVAVAMDLMLSGLSGVSLQALPIACVSIVTAVGVGCLLRDVCGAKMQLALPTRDERFS